MIESLRNALLTGLGAVAFGQERLRAVLDALVEKGELTAEQGRKLLEEFVRRSREEGRSVLSGIASELSRLPEKFPFVWRKEYLRLQSRVEELEKKLSSGSAQETPPAA